ncbi:hypothetical protein [Janthinobacterium sp. GW458P]|uniref:hypothetical protein n=1 Tax=Janthinobacterium sp. GW458P TaxID=1981504 RepID=UPI00111D3395|nr:hypothetical protein [Janthinobacterium sp. GW458P]MBE3027958.1 hypothetical protein [Janthinobacterium sp. GW458P]
MYQPPVQERIHQPAHIDAAAIRACIDQGEQVVIQFTQDRLPAPLLASLDALASTCGTALEIRFFGASTLPFDARVLRALPHAVNLSLDCHMRAIHLEQLGGLSHLKRLCLGVHHLAEGDILALDNLRGLESLSLEPTARAHIDLAPLRHWKRLTQLHTAGHAKNIEAITAVPTLAKLTLAQIKSKDDVDFIGAMPALERLCFILGGRTSIAHVTAPRLRELEVARVRGLEDLGDIGRFPHLERLSVEDQSQVKEVRLGANPALAWLVLRNCKAIEHLSGLAGLPALQALAVHMTRLDIDALLAATMPAALKQLSFSTGAKKRDDAIRAQLTQLGYAKAPYY